MPKFKILRPVEHDHVLYVPEGQNAPDKALSAADGKEIRVDRAGLIELAAKQAEALTARQVEPFKKTTPAATPPK